MDWPVFATYLAACFAAAATGAMFQPAGWYDGLAKPRWTPPGWVFPVVWTTLYLCMAFAAMRVSGLAGNGLAMAFSGSVDRSSCRNGAPQAPGSLAGRGSLFAWAEC